MATKKISALVSEGKILTTPDGDEYLYIYEPDGADDANKGLAIKMETIAALIYESGATLLGIGAIADGGFLRRSGTNVIGDNVDKIEESGGQLLDIGAIADGQFLKRSSTNIAGETLTTFVPLTTPLTSTAWDGDDTKAVSANNALDLNSIFSLPTGSKAVLISVEGSGSGVMWFHTSSGSFKCVTLRPKGGYDSQQGIVPISTANTIYWTVTGSDITYVKMEIQGYWI